MHEPPRLVPGDPARARHGHPAVERHRCLVGDERPALRDPGAPGLVLDPSLEAVVELDLDAGFAQALEAARRLGVRIERGGDDAGDARGDDRLGAGRRGAVVRAGLHRHVERRPARSLAGRGQRDDFAVPAAGLGPALAHDLPVAHEHRRDGRLRIPGAARGRTELERPFEIQFRLRRAYAGHASSSTRRR